jgi:protein TonB
MEDPMPWNRITRVAAALLVSAAVGVPAIYASVAEQVDQQRVRVGGDIKEPKKIKDVKPVYPEAAKAAGVQGIVIIEAIIGTDGTVNEAKVLRPVPELEKAAIDAVMQWKYTPTLLNGEAVEVIMTVTVTFTLQ